MKYNNNMDKTGIKNTKEREKNGKRRHFFENSFKRL